MERTPWSKPPSRWSSSRKGFSSLHDRLNFPGAAADYGVRLRRSAITRKPPMAKDRMAARAASSIKEERRRSTSAKTAPAAKTTPARLSRSAPRLEEEDDLAV